MENKKLQSGDKAGSERGSAQKSNEMDHDDQIVRCDSMCCLQAYPFDSTCYSPSPCYPPLLSQV